MPSVAAMLFCAGAALFCEPAILAQRVTSPDKLPPAVRAFDDESPDSLPCSVHTVKPELNFGFRFQTGYTFQTSLDPYLDRDHKWYIVFRVTPENNAGPPVYFLDSIDSPARSLTGLVGEDSGAFQTGEGRYHVKWALIDDVGRVCRQEWTIDAHPTLSERSEKIEMPPGAVGDFSSRSPEDSRPVPKSRHVTILLNAALPLRSPLVVVRAGLVRSGDPPTNAWGMMLSMLASIVEHMPEAEFRVVAFDTDQQRELFRKDKFTVDDMNDLASVANAKQRWSVDYHALQDPAGAWHLLRNLENKEINASPPPDTVVFLGVPDGRFDVMPPGMPGPKTPLRFFYLKYGPAPSLLRLGTGPEGNRTGLRGPAMPGDATSPLSVAPQAPQAADREGLIEQSVAHLHGRTFLILTTRNFSKALAAIKR